MLSKIWVWDPGSGKTLFRIPDPGVKKAPDLGSGSETQQSFLGGERGNCATRGGAASIAR